jgi:transcriptional regulator with XRE-family HTH domain
MYTKKNKTDYPSSNANGFDAFFKKSRNALGKNFLSARQVAGTGKDEITKATSNTAIHNKTGIARSTLQKIIDGKNNKGPSNPDLETICRLAWALNIPPAFLLMSSDDWKRLIFSINTMQTTVQQNEVLYTSIIQSIKHDKATAGLKLIKKLGTYPDKLNAIDESEFDRLSKDIDKINETKLLSILSMTAIAQSYESTAPSNSSQKSREDYMATLTTLAAIFGSGVRIN